MTQRVSLKFRGDKSAFGQNVAGHVIGRLVQGTVVDVNGLVIGRYQRVKTDAGPYKDWQEIDIFIELENK